MFNMSLSIVLATKISYQFSWRHRPNNIIQMGPKKSDKTKIKSIKCPYYDRGYCKHGDECFNRHPAKVCEDEDCFGENCEKRHPNPCKFGIRCAYNRKNVCSYLHANFSLMMVKLKPL